MMGKDMGKEEPKRPFFSDQYMKRQHKGGLQCTCGCRQLRVQATRKWTRGKVIRVRICRNCGRKVETVEQEIAEPEGKSRPSAGS